MSKQCHSVMKQHFAKLAFLGLFSLAIFGLRSPFAFAKEQQALNTPAQQEVLLGKFTPLRLLRSYSASYIATTTRVGQTAEKVTLSISKRDFSNGSYSSEQVGVISRRRGFHGISVVSTAKGVFIAGMPRLLGYQPDVWYQVTKENRAQFSSALSSDNDVPDSPLSYADGVLTDEMQSEMLRFGTREVDGQQCDEYRSPERSKIKIVGRKPTPTFLRMLQEQQRAIICRDGFLRVLESVRSSAHTNQASGWFTKTVVFQEINEPRTINSPQKSILLSGSSPNIYVHPPIVSFGNATNEQRLDLSKQEPKTGKYVYSYETDASEEELLLFYVVEFFGGRYEEDKTKYKRNDSGIHAEFVRKGGARIVLEIVPTNSGQTQVVITASGYLTM